jgi:hypothetical protein
LRTTRLFGAVISISTPDSILAYRLAPNSEYYHSGESDNPIPSKINNFGWRDRDWTISKPETVTRIAVLGDSFVEAMQVEMDSTFLRLAEATLNRRQNWKHIEMMNFGRSGFSPTEELWLLQHDVAAFFPDIVVVCLLPANDIEDVRRETAPEMLRPFYVVQPDGELLLDTDFRMTPEYKVKCFVDGFKRHSAFVSLLTGRYAAYSIGRRLEQKSKEAKERAKLLSGHLSLCTSSPDSEYAKSYRLAKLLLGKMAEACSSRKQQMLLVCLDTEAYLPSREAELVAIDSTFDSNFFEDDLLRLSLSLHIEYLGLQRVFRNEYNDANTPLHWGHWNYEGHRVVARVLTAKLLHMMNTNSTSNSQQRP